MNTEQFIEKMKNIKVNVPDEDFFLEYNKTVYNILDNQEKLIKYIEDKINIIYIHLNEEPDHDNREYLLIRNDVYKDLLERIKSGKYE